ncbi:MAG: glycogen/starch/alpha-glucan phosphorylase, partial [Lentisphaerae bacterium]|nr:glycogen/starch/alpha-glucan phosphorylase [Lentisphaerota bacterium]
IPAADLSEQISTAGREASGTGNMKLALNGALTIGTWDGANIEIAQAVGRENIFIFGYRAAQLARLTPLYNPREFYQADPELAAALDAIGANQFAPEFPAMFAGLLATLLEKGDHYFLLADYRPYLNAQAKVSALYRQRRRWARQAILNVARLGRFSSDRAVREYARDIWQIKPLAIRLPTRSA